MEVSAFKLRVKCLPQPDFSPDIVLSGQDIVLSHQWENGHSNSYVFFKASILSQLT